MTAYPPPSPRMIPARWHGGPQTPTLIVLHSTVSPCQPGGARAVAGYFAREAGKTSAHYVVDPGEVVQTVGDHTIAYHCGYNADSIGIEMCDMPDQDKARWDDPAHRAMETRTVELVAQLCLAYGIPPWFRGVHAARRWGAAGHPARLGGVTTHAVMSDAFHASTHWDPGAWRRYRFMRAVRAEVRRLKKGK